MHVVNAAPDRFTNGMRVRGVQSFTARRGRGEREGGVSPLALLVGCAASLHARCNTQPLDHRNVTLLPCGRLIKFHFFTSFLFFLPSKRDLFERERESAFHGQLTPGYFFRFLLSSNDFSEFLRHRFSYDYFRYKLPFYEYLFIIRSSGRGCTREHRDRYNEGC